MNALVLRSSSTPKISRVITGGKAQESYTPQQLCLFVYKFYYCEFSFNLDEFYFHNANDVVLCSPLSIQ